MTEASLATFQRDLKKLCDKAVDDREPIRVRRRNGRDVVVVAADEYESMAETAYLLSSPANASRLLAALARAREGKTKPMSIKELRAALGI